MKPTHDHLRNCSSCHMAPDKLSPLPSHFLPGPSHFRLVSLSTVSSRYLDPLHRKVFLPLWKHSEAYARLYALKQVVYKTENLAYCLEHLLEKVNAKSGVRYSAAYTETGRELRSLADLPDFLSKVILGTEHDKPPSKSRVRPQVSNPTRNLLVLSSTKLLPAKVEFTHSQAHTPHFVQQVSPPRVQFLDPTRRTRKASHHGGSIALNGEAMLPWMTEREKGSGKFRTREATPEANPETDRLNTLFSTEQMETLKKEFTALLQLSLTLPKSQIARLPAHVQQYLLGVKARAQGCARVQQSLAAYLQRALPGLAGKGPVVFKAILRGLGGDGRNLTWHQWMLLNAVLVYQTANDNSKIAFITRVMAIQMIGQVPDLSEALALLAALFPSPSSAYHSLRQQIETMHQEASLVNLGLVRRKCLTGLLNYESLLTALRGQAPETSPDPLTLLGVQKSFHESPNSSN